MMEFNPTRLKPIHDETCLHAIESEYKRINHDPMTVEDIVCSRCYRYEQKEYCIGYTTMKHIDDFYKRFER